MQPRVRDPLEDRHGRRHRAHHQGGDGTISSLPTALRHAIIQGRQALVIGCGVEIRLTPLGRGHQNPDASFVLPACEVYIRDSDRDEERTEHALTMEVGPGASASSAIIRLDCADRTVYLTVCIEDMTILMPEAQE